MLISNADDLGRSRLATDRILECHARGTVTSASAMVFMADSERAAKLARGAGLDTGLHLNLTEPFNASTVPVELREAHASVRRRLLAHNYAPLIYFPFLQRHIRLLVRQQELEYQRLYGDAPSHWDGHHHMHLCANVLLHCLIPRGRKVRKHFTFARGEKSWLNRAFRDAVNRWLQTRYITTDYLFSLSLCRKRGTLPEVLRLAASATVELENHPEQEEDFRWLINEGVAALKNVPKAAYAALGEKGKA